MCKRVFLLFVFHSIQFLLTLSSELFFTHFIFSSLRLHFDLDTPIGFFISTIVQIATILIATELFIATLLIISQLQFFEADFIADLKLSLQKLNDEIALAKGNEKLVHIDETGDLKTKLVNLMQFFSEAKK